MHKEDNPSVETFPETSLHRNVTFYTKNRIITIIFIFLQVCKKKI